MAYVIPVTSLPEFNIDLETLHATLPLQRLLTDSLVLGTILRQTRRRREIALFFGLMDREKKMSGRDAQWYGKG
jgi:hypothetical protein